MQDNNYIDMNKILDKFIENSHTPKNRKNKKKKELWKMWQNKPLDMRLMEIDSRLSSIPHDSWVITYKHGYERLKKLNYNSTPVYLQNDSKF